MSDRRVQQLTKRLLHLTLEREFLIGQIIALEAESDNTSILQANTNFKLGDHVFITNQISSQSGKRTTDKDQIGTVTKITTKRVGIRTDSGEYIIRAPNNISYLQETENEQQA